MKKNMLFNLVTLIILTTASVGAAGGLYAKSKTYSYNSDVYIYGYVSITENSMVRPYTSRVNTYGELSDADIVYVYNGLGKDNYTKIYNGLKVTAGNTPKQKTGTTIQHCNNMQIRSKKSLTSGSVYIDISVSD